MATTTVNNSGGNPLEQLGYFIVGLIIIAWKVALHVGVLFCAVLAVIIGVECVRTQSYGFDLFNLPRYYYNGAMYMSFGISILTTVITRIIHLTNGRTRIDENTDASV